MRKNPHCQPILAVNFQIKHWNILSNKSKAINNIYENNFKDHIMLKISFYSFFFSTIEKYNYNAITNWTGSVTPLNCQCILLFSATMFFKCVFREKQRNFLQFKNVYFCKKKQKTKVNTCSRWWICSTPKNWAELYDLKTNRGRYLLKKYTFHRLRKQYIYAHSS